MIQFQKDGRHYILNDDLEILEVFEADKYPEAEVIETVLMEIEQDESKRGGVLNADA